MGKYYVGISGFRYPGWKKTFYPEKLPSADELYYASRQVGSIELNGTFYASQRPSSFERWHESTPKNFVFSVKGPRFITHILRLRNAEQALSTFFASGVLRLEEKLGPILWQLPPNFKYRKEVLEDFLKLLPHTTKEAAKLAKKANQKYLKEKIDTRVRKNHRLRHALEVRNDSFKNEPSFLKLLKKYRVALVCADAPKKWPYFEESTASFFYARLHGGTALYKSEYGLPCLRKWAKHARKWHGSKGRGKDVFVYFDNDVKTHAPLRCDEVDRDSGRNAEDSLNKDGRLITGDNELTKKVVAYFW